MSIDKDFDDDEEDTSQESPQAKTHQCAVPGCEREALLHMALCAFHRGGQDGVL